MYKKYFLIIFLFVILATPTYALRAADTVDTTVDTKIESGISSFIPKTKQFIIDHTPEFIKKAINSATKVTEEFRIDLAGVMADKKAHVKLEIETIEKDQSGTGEKTWREKMAPVSRKAELFFTNVAYIILSSKILFYGLGIFIVCAVVRFIFKRFF